MRNVVMATACVVLFLLLTFSVAAKSVVSMSMRAQSVEKDRLFTVDILCDSEPLISGSTFEITYDNSIVEFRKANSDLFDIKSCISSNTVDVVLVSDKANKLSGNTRIATLTFKSINDGEFDMNFMLCSCVDEKPEFVTVSSTGLTITVDGDTITFKVSKTSSSQGVAKSVGASPNGESKVIKRSPASVSQTVGDYDAQLENNNIQKAILCGMCSAFAVLLIFYLGMLFSKKREKLSEKDIENIIDE